MLLLRFAHSSANVLWYSVVGKEKVFEHCNVAGIVAQCPHLSLDGVGHEVIAFRVCCLMAEVTRVNDILQVTSLRVASLTFIPEWE